MFFDVELLQSMGYDDQPTTNNENNSSFSELDNNIIKIGASMLT